MSETPESVETIFDALREAILSRRLAPGTRLREVQLCGIFGVTRGVVRQTLRRLAFEGLVELRPNRGASVARPSAEEAAELFAARKCIEVAVARLAAERMTPAALAMLEAHLERERAARAEGAADALIALSGEFHIRLAEIAGNAVLRRYLADIVARESLIIQMFGRASREDCAPDEHARIVAALLSGDPERIGAEVEAHIDGIAAGLDLQPRPDGPRPLEEALRPR